MNNYRFQELSIIPEPSTTMPQTHTDLAIATAMGTQELIATELSHLNLTLNRMEETNCLNMSFTLEQQYRVGNSELYCFGYLDFDADNVTLWTVGSITHDEDRRGKQPHGPRCRVMYENPLMWETLRDEIKRLLQHVQFNLSTWGHSMNSIKPAPMVRAAISEAHNP